MNFKYMRIFHNFIKRKLYNKYTTNINYLLDLACGKGGDLSKWFGNNIKHVIGYDINEISITEAKRRLTSFSGKTDVQLFVKDLSNNELSGSNNVDVISSMFSFHYFFESKSSLNTILKSINNNIKMGGIFMGCLFDGKSVLDHLDKNVNNNNFKITLEKPLHSNELSQRIKVFLNDTVLDEPTDEFLVDFDYLVYIMKSRGFDLIETVMFKELYNKNFKMNKIEKMVSFLNRFFVFKKTSIVGNINVNWNVNSIRVLNDYKTVLIQKQKNENDIIRKNDYQFVIDNLKMTPDIINLINKLNVKRYIIKIYNQFLGDLYIKTDNISTHFDDI